MTKNTTTVPEGWKETTLGEVAEIIGGGTPKTDVPEFWNGDIPWLSVVDFNNDNRWVSKAEKSITAEGLKNSSTKILNAGDIIISARGTVGAFAQLKVPMAFNQSCYGLRANEISENDFLYYLLKHNIQQLKQNVHGAVFDTITRDTFDHVDILLPQPPEQRAIAGVLSSMDDKVELLREQNKTLKDIGHNIWNEAFIKKASPKWKEDSILDLIQLVGGGTPKTDTAEYWDGNIPWLSAKDITANHGDFVIRTEKTISAFGMENSSAKILPEYAMVISARGTVGNYCMLAVPMAFSQSNYGILPKNHACFFFTYYLISFAVASLQSAAYGSVFDTITTETFRTLQIQIPPIAQLQAFEARVAPLFRLMRNNTHQIQTLSALRDTLLPKLMKGEIRI